MFKWNYGRLSLYLVKIELDIPYSDNNIRCQLSCNKPEQQLKKNEFNISITPELVQKNEESKNAKVKKKSCMVNKQGKSEMKNETSFQPLINQFRLRKEGAIYFCLNKVPVLQQKR